MIVEELSKTRAAEQFETMLAKGFKPIALKNPELKTISKELTRLMVGEAVGKSPYQQDLLYGRELFRVLSNASWFNWGVATNDDFWRFLSVCAIPNVVFDRFANEKNETIGTDALKEHFYAKHGRIYPFSLYWIYRICDQGSLEKTYEFLSKPCFGTDMILNVAERMGPKGFRVDVYREILQRFADLRHEEYSKSIGAPNQILRSLLVQHGVKNAVFIPESHEGGVEGYIEELFVTVLGEDYV